MLEPRGRILFAGKFKQKGKTIDIRPATLLTFAIPKPPDLDPKKYKMRRGIFIPSDMDKPMLAGSKVVQRAEFLIEKVLQVPDYDAHETYDIDLTQIKDCELYFELGIAYACGSEHAPTFSNPSTAKLVEIKSGKQTKKVTAKREVAEAEWETLSEEKIHELERERVFETGQNPKEAAALAKMTYNERHRKQLLDGKQSLINQIATIQRERPDAPPEYLAMLKERLAAIDPILKDVEAKITRGEKGGGED